MDAHAEGAAVFRCARPPLGWDGILNNDVLEAATPQRLAEAWDQIQQGVELEQAG